MAYYWKKEDEEFIIRCYNGRNLLEIAKEFEEVTTVAAVRSKIKKLQDAGRVKTIKERFLDIKDTERVCKFCERTLDISNFSQIANKNAYHYCKECVNEKNRINEANKKVSSQIKKNTEESNAIKEKIREKQEKSHMCPGCKKEKAGTEFYYNKSTGYRLGKCKECDKVIREKNRLKQIREFRGNENE